MQAKIVDYWPEEPGQVAVRRQEPRGELQLRVQGVDCLVELDLSLEAAARLSSRLATLLAFPNALDLSGRCS